jgi:hypothetical protein
MIRRIQHSLCLYLGARALLQAQVLLEYLYYADQHPCAMLPAPLNVIPVSIYTSYVLFRLLVDGFTYLILVMTWPLRACITVLQRLGKKKTDPSNSSKSSLFNLDEYSKNGKFWAGYSSDVVVRCACFLLSVVEKVSLPSL